MAGGPQQQMQDQQQGYGPPPKSGSNAGLFVGIGVGVVVLILIIVAVVASGGPTPQDVQMEKQKQAADERKERAEKLAEETRKENEAIQKPIDASLEQATAVFAALQNEDAATLEALFDWNLYAEYNKSLVNENADHLNSPLVAQGEWEKDSSGKYTGKFMGQAAHTPDSLKQRVMGYIKEFMFGAEGLEWERAKTEHEDGGFTLTIGGTKYLGKKVFITYKGAGKSKTFSLGAPKGSDQVRLLHYHDGSSIKNLQTTEAKNPKGTAGQGDPRNPDRDPRNPDRDPEDPDNPPEDPDASLPEIAKTGSMPNEPALVNAVKDLERGDSLNQARVRAVKAEPSKPEKKAAMGAMIDLLIDAQASNDRTMKLRVSSALWDIWNPFVPSNLWSKSDMVYELDNFGTQSSLDTPVRRWLDIYNNYPLD